MTAQVYPTRAATTALLALLQAAAGAAGDGDVPADRTLPYPVLYPLGSATFDGTMARDGLQADAWPTWQVTYVGESREQAEWLRDKVRPALLGAVLTIAGWTAQALQLLDEQPAQRDDDVNPPLFYAVDRFRAYLTPEG